MNAMKFFICNTGNLDNTSQPMLDPRSADRVVRDEVVVRAALDPNLAMLAAIRTQQRAEAGQTAATDA